MTTTTEYLLQGAATTLLSTELNGLAASAYALGPAFDNENPTANFNGYTDAEIEIVLAAPSGPFAANSAIYLWFIKSIDGGTNYEDNLSGSSLVSAQAPDYQFPVAATANAQRIVRRIRIPPGYFKTMAGNIQGSGTQAYGAPGNTVKIKPFTTQGV